MNVKKTVVLFIAAAGMLCSCASTSSGSYKTLDSHDGVATLGFVQTTVLSQRHDRKQTVNDLVYIRLMEEAGKTYTGVFDVVDITWAVGKRAEYFKLTYEYSANGRVVRLD